MAKLGTFLRLVRRRLAGDRMAGFWLLHRLGSRLCPGYRFVDPRLDWWEDAGFDRFLRAFHEEGGLNTQRKWMVGQLLRLVDDLDGDTAECGAYLGATSFLICAANRARGRTHHVFDSFEGLSEPGERDGDHWRAGDLSVSEATVRDVLSGFDRVRLHRGWIPERFPDVADRTFAFVHVDVDLYEPTRDSVAFFLPRLVPGGILVCDDYGQSSCPGATRAVDELLAERPENMLAMPDGGGFLIAGRPTGDAGRSSWAERLPDPDRLGERESG